MISVQHKCPWGLPCWATCPVNNRVPIPIRVPGSSTHGLLPCFVLQHHPPLHPAHPISVAAKISWCFYARNPQSWKKRRESAVQGDSFECPRDCVQKQTAHFVAAGAR